MLFCRLISSFALNTCQEKRPGERATLAEKAGQIWNLGKMRAYFSLVKQREPIKISGEARAIFSAYYARQRNCSRSGAYTTVRLLESLMRWENCRINLMLWRRSPRLNVGFERRLAQAHAKLMWKEGVNLDDAVVAVYLMEQSMLSTGLLTQSSILKATFPVDPDNEQDLLG